MLNHPARLSGRTLPKLILKLREDKNQGRLLGQLVAIVNFFLQENGFDWDELGQCPSGCSISRAETPGSPGRWTGPACGPEVRLILGQCQDITYMAVGKPGAQNPGDYVDLLADILIYSVHCRWSSIQKAWVRWATPPSPTVVLPVRLSLQAGQGTHTNSRASVM